MMPFLVQIEQLQMTQWLATAFAANAVRLQLHALAYNLANFLRTLATPEPMSDWSLTTLKEKLIKIGAKVVSHGRYIAFQMAEVAIPRHMFQEFCGSSPNCGRSRRPRQREKGRWSCIQERLREELRPDAKEK